MLMGGPNKEEGDEKASENPADFPVKSVRCNRFLRTLISQQDEEGRG